MSYHRRHVKHYQWKLLKCNPQNMHEAFWFCFMKFSVDIWSNINSMSFSQRQYRKLRRIWLNSFKKSQRNSRPLEQSFIILAGSGPQYKTLQWVDNWPDLNSMKPGQNCSFFQTFSNAFYDKFNHALLPKVQLKLLVQVMPRYRRGALLDIKMSSYQYKDSHY